MRERKIPLRTCILTKEKLPKRELIRIVRTPEGNIELDLSGKKNGRGVYLKNDIEVFKLAKEKNILEKVFEENIDKEIYEELLNI